MCAVEATSSMPAVIWSGVIGSGMTLLGVLLVNKSNNNRHKMQLKHESDEKAKDRLATLRKEVYLLAVEEMVKASDFLGRLPTFDFTKGNPAEGLTGLYASMAKLQMVAGKQTAVLIGEMQATFTEVFFKLLVKANPIHGYNSDIEIRNKHYDDTQLEIARILSKIAELRESGQVDPYKYQPLHASFNKQQELAKQISDERSLLYEKKNALHIKYSTELPLDIRPIQEIQALLLIEIRSEIGIETEKDGLTKQIEASNKRMMAASEKLFNDLPKA
jgi:hypothetical protein